MGQREARRAVRDGNEKLKGAADHVAWIIRRIDSGAMFLGWNAEYSLMADKAVKEELAAFKKALRSAAGALDAAQKASAALEAKLPP